MKSGLTVSAGRPNVRKAFSPAFLMSEIKYSEDGVTKDLYYRSGFKEYLASDEHLVPFIDGAEKQNFPIQPRSELVETYGYIFKLPKDDDSKIHKQMLSQGYNRIAQFAYIDHTPEDTDGTPVFVPESEKYKYLQKFKVVLFLDMKHTRDGTMNVYANAVEEVLWDNGLGEMRAAGAPALFLDKVRRKLKGDRVEIENIFTKHDSEFEEILREEARKAKIQDTLNNQQIAELAMDLSDIKCDYQREAVAEDISRRYLTRVKKEEIAEENRSRAIKNEKAMATEKQRKNAKAKEALATENRRQAVKNERARAFEEQRKNTASHKRGHKVEEGHVEPPAPKRIKLNIQNPGVNSQAGSAAVSRPKRKHPLSIVTSIDD